MNVKPPLPTYEPLGPLGGPELHLRFTGPFEQREVVWDARFLTLNHYRACYAPDANELRNFIEIGAEGEHGRGLLVALDVAYFDAPTVVKTIIMVRQYKRLRIGRMEFGDPKRFVAP